MSKKKDKGGFEACFKRTLAAGRSGDVSALIVLAPHPRAQHIAYAEKGDLKGGDVWAPWFGSDTHWLGAAAWVFPKNFQEELMASGGGALFSHAHGDIQKNEAYLTLLGPVGASVAGSSWNTGAFHEQKWPFQIDVGTFDIQCGSAQAQMPLKKGKERPVWWPEPLPMVERLWLSEDPPSLAPDLGRVAAALALQMRANTAQAIFEEVGAQGARSAPALGTVIELPGRLARHFGRRDHALGGPARLRGNDLGEALQALEMMRTGFEAWSIERVTRIGGPARPAPRI